MIGLDQGVQLLPQDPIPMVPGQSLPLILGPDNVPAFVVDCSPNPEMIYSSVVQTFTPSGQGQNLLIELVPIVFGDVDMSGTTNLLDVSHFINHISNGLYKPQADLNLDGVVNLLDVDLFIQVLAGG